MELIIALFVHEKSPLWEATFLVKNNANERFRGAYHKDRGLALNAGFLFVILVTSYNGTQSA